MSAVRMCLKSNHFQAFTHIPYNTSYFDHDSIKNEQASMEIQLLYLKYMGYFSDTQGQECGTENRFQIRTLVKVLQLCKTLSLE